MDLHGRIMNLPAEPEKGQGINYTLAYKHGHRDARHAAAELALKANAIADAARAVLAWRVNEPMRGDLRDNDRSRDALRGLWEAVAAFDGQAQ